MKLIGDSGSYWISEAKVSRLSTILFRIYQNKASQNARTTIQVGGRNSYISPSILIRTLHIDHFRKYVRRAYEGVERSLIPRCANEDYPSGIGRIGFSRSRIERQEQLCNMSCAERICMLHTSINSNTKKKGKENITSTSAPTNFSILSMISTVGRCQSAFSNQYLNKAFTFEIGCSEYRAISTYNVSGPKNGISKGKGCNDKGIQVNVRESSCRDLATA